MYSRGYTLSLVREIPNTLNRLRLMPVEQTKTALEGKSLTLIFKKRGENNLTRNRSQQINIRATEKEKTMLLEKAKTARMSMSEYVLALSENKKIIVADNLPNLILEITRIGVNINQITAVANSNKTVNEFQIENLCVSLHEVKKILKMILNEFYGDDKCGNS